MRGERRVRELLRVIAEAIRGETPPGVVASVISVSQPQHGTILVVEVSVFPDERAAEIVAQLNAIERSVRQLVRQRIYMRHLPRQIRFVYSAALKQQQELGTIEKSE